MALRLSNPHNPKIPGCYELHHRLRRAVLWACLLGSPFFLGSLRLGFRHRVNLTPSLPLGFSLPAIRQRQNLLSSARKETRPISRSSANIAPQGLAGWRSTASKPGVAFPGDEVEVSANGIRVNGHLLPNSAGRFRDHLQRPLDPWPYGTYKVERGTVWVVSSFNSYSFDSRYYGPIPNSAIRHHLRPLWTFATEVLSSSVTVPAVAATTAAIAWSGHLAASLFRLSLRYSCTTRNRESTPSLRCSATTRLQAGRSSRSPRFLWSSRHSAHWIVAMLGRRSATGVAVGFALQARTGESCILCAALHPAHRDAAARDHRMGFATSFRRCSFPGSKWFGLALITVFLIAFRFKPALSVVSLALCAFVFHFQYTQPHVPAGWEAVNTNYGGTGQGDPDFTTEYNTAQTMQTTILESHATVLLFPEHLLAHWNESTDVFWGDTLTALASQHRTVLMGAGINPPGTSRNSFARKRYLNVLLARGEENTALYQERIPVPIAMWRPLSDDGVPLKLFARGTIRIHNLTPPYLFVTKKSSCGHFFLPLSNIRPFY